MPYFEVRGLTRRPWFEAFDLDLEAGEIAVLTGPTGSGKTLLLRALADLDPADAGEVRLEGIERGTIPASAWRARVVYLHQEAVRLQGTVRANLERVEALATHRGLVIDAIPGVEDTTDAARLSGGEAQRLALQRAFAVSPAVLLLDESTSALDGAAAREEEQRVERWASGGRAALWVSHDRSLARRLGAREVVFP